MKNQIKKSLSLLMAVLMLMSCWVWVAPTEAEAAVTQTYKVTVSFKITNECEGGGHFKVWYYRFKDDGTGINTGDSDVYNVINSLAGYSETTHTVSADIPGWPYKAEFKVADGSCDEEALYYGFTINGVSVFNMQDGGDLQWTLGGNKSVTHTYTDTKADSATIVWPVPELELETDTGTVEVESPSYPGNTGTWNNSTYVTITGKDASYPGVKWAKLPTVTSRISPDNSGSTASTALKNAMKAYNGTTRADSVTGEKIAVAVNSDIQKQQPNKDIGTYYIYSTCNGKTVSTAVNVTSPKYEIKYNANAADASFAEGSPESQPDLVYGSKITQYPKDGTRTGYDFLGMTKGKTVNGVLVGEDDSHTLTRPSVTYLDGTQTVDTDGSTTWFAHWGAKEITATFRNADGQYIGTLPGRYNRPIVHSDIYLSVDKLNEKLQLNYPDAIKWDTNGDPVYEANGREYVFSHWKLAEAYDLEGNDIMDNLPVNPNSGTTLFGNAVFEAVYVLKADSAKKYNVTFYNEDGTVLNESTYSYREKLTFPTAPEKARDVEYNYTFRGWAEKAGETGVNSYVIYEDGLTEDDIRVDFIDPDEIDLLLVRDNKNYVPVFEAKYNEYSVYFKYHKDGGVEYEEIEVSGLKFRDEIVKPASVKTNYTANGFRFTFGDWKASNNVKYEEGLTLERFEAVLNSNFDTKIVFTPTIAKQEAAVYTINFYDIDGKLINNAEGANQVTHGAAVVIPAAEQIVDRYEEVKDDEGNVVDKIYTERYTFKGWSPAVSATAGADAEYNATYTMKRYADVTYYDATGAVAGKFNGKVEADTEKLFVGDALPQLVENIVDENGAVTGTKPVEPAKADDVRATYTFKGWATKAGATVDDIIDLETATITSSSMYLYPVYEETLKNYTVKFVNDDGDVLSEKKDYHYGEEVILPEENPTKASDNTYKYTFRGWSPSVSAACYGDATYTATYRREYIYYRVTWFKDTKDISDPYSVANYIYNERINMPGTPTPTDITGDPGEGYSWVIKEWVACDKNGNKLDPEKIFTRGDRMGADALYFYPTYEKKANQLTVEFYDDTDKLISKEAVPYNTPVTELDAYAPEIIKEATEENHFNFTKWVNKANGADLTGNITSNMELKAVFTQEEHNFVIDNTVVEPTCTDTGIVNMKCSCGKTVLNVVHEPLADNAAPEGTVYIGNNRWTSQQYANGEINYDDLVYVGPKAMTVVNATDVGTRSMPWNLDASKTSRVGKIYFYLSETVIEDVDSITDASWIKLFDYDDAEAEVLERVLSENSMTKAQYTALDELNPDDEALKKEIDIAVANIMANYQANATNTLENIGLTDGKEYVIYMKLVDRARVIDTVNGGLKEANNVRIFSTGMFHYGTKAPEIVIEGDGTGSKYCTIAKIRVADDFTGAALLKISLDGEAVASRAGILEVTQTGIHTVSVTDGHGNVTTKTFEIKGGHTNRQYYIASTCEADGWRYEQCTLCGTIGTYTKEDASGHKYGKVYIDTVGTCVEDGKRTYTCENGCGTIQVATPTSVDSDTFKTFTDAEKAAIKALAKTGHTYYADDDGNVIIVVDKAATCIENGSQYKQCKVCYLKEYEEILVPENIEDRAHSYYRPVVDKAATCTEDGYKSQDCKYCDYTKVNVEKIDKLGHLPDEDWTETVAPKCNETGTQVKYCQRGCVDADNNKIIVEIETIPVLGHKYAPTGEPYHKDGDNETWYQKFVCPVCQQEEERDVAYTKKIPAKVTFVNEGETYKVFGENEELYVGDTIIATQVPRPNKASTASVRYVFDCWVDKAGNEVTFPISVGAELEGDADSYEVTYEAKYEAKDINYTVTYLKEVVDANGRVDYEVYRKVGYLKNGVEYDTVEPPAKSSTSTHTYEFSHWTIANDLGDTREYCKDKIKIDADDFKNNALVLQPVYNEIVKTYTITFVINYEYYTLEVEAGQEAPEDKINELLDQAGTPEKEADDNYHYSFDGWNKEGQLSDVTGDIYTAPVFKETAHNLVIDYDNPIQEADCDDPQILKKACSGEGCDYYTTVIGQPAFGHDWGDVEYGENGETVRTCRREGCGEKTYGTANYTVTFMDGDKPIKVKNYVNHGTDLKDIVPADPTKGQTATHTYTFKGWATKKDAKPEDAIDVNTTKVKANVTYYAIFEASVRKYTVVFAYNASNPIKSYTEIEAGTKITFNKENKDKEGMLYYDGPAPVKEFNNNQHFTFDKWNVSEGYEVVADLYIVAQFIGEKHVYYEGDVVAAECETGEGTTMECVCGRSYVIETSDSLGHDMKETERHEATAQEDGYIVYTCQRKGCGHTKIEKLYWNDSSVTISVRVIKNGQPMANVEVEIQGIGDARYYLSTNANGYATFTLSELTSGEYQAYAKINGERVRVALEQTGERTFAGEYSFEEEACTCACHRDNFWGTIFRFFHKLIKMFTGEFSCCNDPDPKYN